MPKYTVVGMVNGERAAVAVEASTAAEAELLTDLEWVVAVLEGVHVVDPPHVYDEERAWTVFGYYPDNEQRYATDVAARSAPEAEVTARRVVKENDASVEDPAESDLDIVVVGVVEGYHEVADLYAGDEGMACAGYARATLLAEVEREALKAATRPVPKPGARSRRSGLAERVAAAVCA